MGSPAAHSLAGLRGNRLHPHNPTKTHSEVFLNFGSHCSLMASEERCAVELTISDWHHAQLIIVSRIWHVHGEETMCVVLTLSLIHILPLAMPNPYLIPARARAPACVPAPCQNNELCLIPIIPWQMPPGVAILYSWEPEQNGWLSMLAFHAEGSMVGALW